MKAIILAAGLGTRLRPITNEKSKALVEVNGTSLLENQINCLDRNEISEIVIVTGYMHEQIESFIEKINVNTSIDLVRNEDYSNTDNLYSFLLTEEVCKNEEIILMNGDIFVRDEVFDKIIEFEHSCIACDFKNYDQEAMKVTGEREKLEGISKDIGRDSSLATSIDIYKFSDDKSRKLYEIASDIFDPNEKQWTELAIDKLLKEEQDVKACDIGSQDWAEIDNLEDLLDAEKKFSDVNIEDYDRIIIDLDGTVYLDDKAIEGSKEAIEVIRENNSEIRFMSNNSSSTNEKYQEKLEKIGIKAHLPEIVISTDMVISELKERNITEVFVLGTERMKQKLKDGEIEHSEQADMVVVGFDKELTYNKVKKACLKIQGGAEFLLAHKDLRCPTNRGFIPDAGSIGQMISSTTKKEPKKIFGKPTDEMADYLKSDKKTLVIGDRLSTDIKLGQKMGADTILVLSGDSTRIDVEKSKNPNPTLVIKNLGKIKDL